MRPSAALAAAVTASAVAVAVAGCKGTPTAADIADRAWRAHELVVAAGEREPTCAAAGAAMQRAFDEHRQAFVEGIKLDRDRARLEAATAYIEAHEGRYKDLEDRMAALSDRCADEPTVVAVFQRMESP
ncbi:MAG TPA: hypothetical protein VNO30_34770 [Kofleriaceae bacterium]|nr:hypothetical protein [Kofleriaceae bacterium]